MDIRTIIQDGRGHWTVSSPGLSEESGLDTAIIISLFTDRRAEQDDMLPDDGDDRRGWWGDAFPDVPGDRIGSRWWLLRRSKITDETLRKLEEYGMEALQWMVEDRVAVDLSVVATRVSRNGVQVDIYIHRPRTGTVKYRFTDYWEG